MKKTNIFSLRIVWLVTILAIVQLSCSVGLPLTNGRNLTTPSQGASDSGMASSANSAPKVGHWQGDHGLSFDVTADGRVINFKMALDFYTTDLTNMTCVIHLPEFAHNQTGEFVFGNPTPPKNELPQYITGRFTSTTKFEGAYVITICRDSNGRTNIGSDPNEKKLSANWKDLSTPEDTETPIAGLDNSIGPTHTLPPRANLNTTPEPTATEAPWAKTPPEVKVDWFHQEPDNPRFLGFLLSFQSSSSSLAQLDASYKVTAYDAAGEILGYREGYSGYIFPGQPQPFFGGIYLADPNPKPVDHLTVEITVPGRLVDPPGGKNGPVTADRASFFMAQNSNVVGTSVVGMLHNQLDRSISPVSAVALAYDNEGNLLYAGSDYIEFLPAKGSCAVQVNFHDLKVHPSRVELVPALDSDARFINDDPPFLIVENTGEISKGDGLVWGYFTVRNNTSQVLEQSVYIVSLFDDQDLPVAVSKGELGPIFPDSRTAEIVGFNFEKGIKVSRMEVLVQHLPPRDPGNQPAAITGLGPVNVDQVVFAADKMNSATEVIFTGHAFARITNAGSQDINAIQAIAIVYDPKGQIIGGGRQMLGVLAVGKQVQADITVDYQGFADKIEVFTTLLTHANSNAPANPENTSAPQADQPEILSTWFRQLSSNKAVVEVAALIENPNTSMDLKGM